MDAIQRTSWNEEVELFLFFGFVVGFGDELFDLFKIFDYQPGF
jgi:hypothetical protein